MPRPTALCPTRRSSDRSPMPRPPALCPTGRSSDRRPFGVLQRQPQLLRQRIHRRPATLPGPFGLEPQVADAAAPRRDGTADGAEVGAVDMLLVQPADDVRRDAHEGAERVRALDAVLAAVPGGAEHLRDLLQVIHEELLRLFAERLPLLAGAEGFQGEQLLDLLRERRLRDAAGPDTQQLDLPVERRVFAVVQRADDIVRRGEVLVTIQLPPGERHEVRRVQPRVLRVDRHEHLDDVIFGETVEDDRGHGEGLVTEPLDVRVQREQPVLPVDRAEDPFALRHLQYRALGIRVDAIESQRLIARDDDRPRDGREGPRLAALLVILDELVDLPADDRPLIGLVARGDAALQKIPVDLRWHAALLATTADRLSLFAVIEDFEPHELVDV